MRRASAAATEQILSDSDESSSEFSVAGQQVFALAAVIFLLKRRKIRHYPKNPALSARGPLAHPKAPKIATSLFFVT
jgi:hypothetical protein